MKDYIEAAREAVKKEISDLDREAYDVHGWIESEQYDDLRQGFTERLFTLAKLRRKLTELLRP